MRFSAVLFSTALITAASSAQARDQIRIVGSSTVYPFVSAAAEQFGQGGEFKTPIVEATGTGGGFKLFCAGVGDNNPDINNASRQITASEVELCGKNGVKNIVELPIGYDGIILANSVQAPRFDLTKKQIFLALAREVPGKDGKLIKNPHQKWSDIDPKLPAQAIEVYGPPPTSGTRDAFVELVMETGCKEIPEFVKAYADESARKKACSLLREDGKYIEAGEDDNMIIQKLAGNKSALGILGYGFLEENKTRIQASKIGGVEPDFTHIEDGSYGVSRSLYVYLKGEQAANVPGMKEFARELVSEAAIGADGYLIAKGLLPLKAEERKKAEAVAKGFGK